MQLINPENAKGGGKTAGGGGYMREIGTMWQIGVLTGKPYTLLVQKGSFSAFWHYKNKERLLMGSDLKWHIPSTCLDARQKRFSIGIYSINMAFERLLLETQKSPQNGQIAHGFPGGGGSKTSRGDPPRKTVSDAHLGRSPKIVSKDHPRDVLPPPPLFCPPPLARPRKWGIWHVHVAKPVARSEESKHQPYCRMVDSTWHI